MQASLIKADHACRNKIESFGLGFLDTHELLHRKSLIRLLGIINNGSRQKLAGTLGIGARGTNRTFPDGRY